MRNASIGVKITLAFLTTLIIVLVVGIVALAGIHHLVRASQQKDRAHDAMITMDRLLVSAVNCETGVRGYVLTGKDSYLAPYRSGLQSFPAQLDRLESLLSRQSPAGVRVSDLRHLFAQIQQNWAAAIALRQSRPAQTGAQQTLQNQTIVLIAQGKTLMDRFRRRLSSLSASEQQLFDARSRLTLKTQRFASAIILYGILLACLLKILLTLVMTRNIASPLRRVTAAAQEIARGKFDVEFAIAGRGDEIGQLYDSFLLMISALRTLASQAQMIAAGDLTGEFVPRGPDDQIGNAFAAMRSRLVSNTSQLKQSSAVLASSVEQILAAVAEVNSGVTETAASVTQTTATVEEVRQTASLSSQKARTVSEIAQKSVEISSQGRAAVEESTAGMERIRQQMSAIAESIVRLSEHGQAIGEIIAVVNDLAEQSNLLAVNAAIEAVRAGEHGRSFAVVAQEVRSLADQSRQATAQVRGILNEVQKATSAAVMTAEQGNRAVDDGLRQASASGDAMAQLEAIIAEASRAAVQIAASSHQQFVGMDQIAEAITSIKQASLQNVTSARQVQSAAHHLQPVGEELERLIRMYRTAATGA